MNISQLIHPTDVDDNDRRSIQISPRVRLECSCTSNSHVEPSAPARSSSQFQMTCGLESATKATSLDLDCYISPVVSCSKTHIASANSSRRNERGLALYASHELLLDPFSTSDIPAPRPAKKREVSDVSQSGSRAKRQTRWSEDENVLLIQCRASGMNWKSISKRLPDRTAISCRLHYQNYLEHPVWDEERRTKLALLYKR